MDKVSQDYVDVLAALRQRWLAYVVFCIAFLIGGFMLLLAEWEQSYALRWLAVSTAAMGYPILILWREIKHNHRPGDSTLLSSLGPGNLLSLLRGTLVAGLAGFLFSPWPVGWLAWLPGGMYVISDATDFLDGYLARKSGHTTRLGEILEMSFDGLGVLVASLLIVQYGQVPIWYLGVAFARYLFLGGIWIRQRLGMPVYELPPSVMRRAFAGLQMGFVAAVLLPVFSPPGTAIAAALFALPFLAGFLRDWFFVSGVGWRIRELPGRTKAVLEGWLPVALRVALLLGALPSIVRHLLALESQTPFMVLITVLEAIALLAVAAGFAGRVAAVIGLVILGIFQNIEALTIIQYLMAATYTAILFLGTGPYSLWKPEEYLIHHHIGERQVVQKQVGFLDEASG